MITADEFLASHKIIIPESQSVERQSAEDGCGERSVERSLDDSLDSSVESPAHSADKSGSQSTGSTEDARPLDDHRGTQTFNTSRTHDRKVTDLRDAVACITDKDEAHAGKDTEAVPGELSESDVDTCREAALRLLDAAPRSSGGLKQRLIDKEFDEAVIDEVISRLQRVLLINDEAYAESAVRYCLSRNMGARYTERELLRKGVDRTLTRRLIAESTEAGQFVDAAYELGRTVLRKTQGMDPIKRKRRFWSAGGRKGHAPDIIRQVANELFDNA
ncbi:regulatory protein RecX [Bifidobacterium aquikefiri]|uniref:regulatory protein RecX n=1 Tax=Bifidobacterium aquikefiri TaxID=1653207 RepID=UPI0039E91A75